VYPERKWYIACSGVSREMGGSTPNASAVRKTTFFGCPPAARDDGVGDVVDRVRGPRVLGDRAVVEVDLAGALVEDHVLEDRPEHLGRLVDLRLALPRQADGLRVAAALEVEDAVVAPAVLVVADEATARVGRERRLARAREAEEERDVPLVPDVRRAVHRERRHRRAAGG
jgi:hypothetical protein